MYVINLDDKNSKGTHLVSLLIDIKLAAYFVSSGIKYISLELLNKIREKSNQLLAICLESKIMNVKKVDATRNDILDEVKRNDLMCKKNKKTCKYLNYVKQLLILNSTITGCISVTAFTSLLAIFLVLQVLQ